jgi:hypothetical protein
LRKNEKKNHAFLSTVCDRWMTAQSATGAGRRAVQSGQQGLKFWGHHDENFCIPQWADGHNDPEQRSVAHRIRRNARLRANC